MKVRALPTCRKPVGDGANRTRSITFENSGIGAWPLASVETGLSPPPAARHCGDAARPRLYRKSKWLPMGYEGNSSPEYRCSGIASYKKILLETPCPGRNLPEDTCCFNLSGVTGLGQHFG